MRTLGFLLTLSVCASAAEDWPRLFTFEDGVRLVLHEPQVEAWEDFRTLDLRLVAGIELPSGNAVVEALGVVRLRLRTTLDVPREVALLDRPEVREVSFPTLAGDLLGRAGEVVSETADFGSAEIRISDLLVAVEGKEADEAREVDIDTTPPALITSHQAAILIAFDGEPVFGPIEGSDLEIALNTPSLLFRQAQTGWHYLFGWESWIKSRDLKAGKWVAAPKLPSAFGRLPDDDLWRELKKRMPGKPLKDEEVPRVFVATEPTELLVSYGDPTFKPIEGTSLTYVDNTENDVFLNAADGLYYVLLSGRWFRTRGLGHPLEFCTQDLPDAFSKIPPDHDAGRVLASVPGTKDAAEALAASRLLRQATVRRGEIELEVGYTGAPSFTPIPGTKVQFAENTDLDVFAVEGRYLCCSDGVWFEAAAPKGAWKLCDAVPEAIYSIPAKHAAYNVTFVRVVGSTPESVTYAYANGYFGSYGHGGVVVWGTGWRHPWSVDYWRQGWANRSFWLERWQREEFHSWHRSLTYGQGRWFDQVAGVYRVGYDAMAHAKVRVHRGQAYRTWRDKAVLPAEARERSEPKPEVKARPKPRVVKNAADLYAGPDGQVYKRAHGSWYKQKKDGSWVHLSGRPVLKEDVERMRKLEKARAERERASERERRKRDYRRGYGGRCVHWYRARRWHGARIARPLPAFGGGGLGGIGIGGW
jgi:hypothetical protein